MKRPGKKLLSNLFVITATAAVISICLSQLISLGSASSILRETDLLKIDSVRMLSRAFMIGGSKSARSIEFEDENRKIFTISSSISGEKTLYDTLQYSDLVMSVLTDKEGFDNYRNTGNNEKIEVYGILIGGKSYINLEEVSSRKYSSKLALVFVTLFIYMICLAQWFHSRAKEQG